MTDIVDFETLLKMPLMQLPVRTPLISLANAKVLVSPGSRLRPEQLQEMAGATDIIAPNLFHCAGVPKAAAAAGCSRRCKNAEYARSRR